MKLPIAQKQHVRLFQQNMFSASSPYPVLYCCRNALTLHDLDVQSAKREASCARRSVCKEVRDPVALGGHDLLFSRDSRIHCREARGMGLVRESRLNTSRMVVLSVRG